VETPSLGILTKREEQILCYVADGCSNKSVAVKLKISARTVEAHRAHLTEKLGIKTTAGLVRYAISKGLV
jgi:two-component system response regulator NreC